MHRNLARLLTAGTIVAGMVGGGLIEAGAETTWTVSPGGAFTASLAPGTTATLTDTTTNNSITCSVGTAGGSLRSGSGLSGTGIGTITSGSFGSSANRCSGPLGSSWTVTLTSGTTWQVNAVSFDAASGVTNGMITGVDTTISGSSFFGSCSARATGTVSGTYTNSTAALALNSASLTISGVSGSGCANRINNGDSATLTATAVVNPAQTITSP